MQVSQASQVGQSSSAVLAQVAPHDHLVQLYDDDAALIAPIAEFVRAGIAAGEPVVMIVSAARRAQLADVLEGVTVLDAAETLATFMEGDAPSWPRFRDGVGAVIAAAARSRPGATVRAYGEMVDLLWQAGQQRAALTLEGYWNELARSHNFALLCAYAMAHFVRLSDAAPLAHVCGAHSRVLPAGAPVDGRALAALQQRSQALEAEVRSLRAREARYQEAVTSLIGHDLRNPLGAMMMGADYIARLGLGDRPSRHAGRIAASAVRMSRMIDQLLDFTRIWIGGGVALVLGEVELAAVCEELREDLDHASIVIARDGDLRGRWDRDCLAQVFATVIGNAVTHGRGDVSIQLTGGEVVVATVHNSGAIPAAALAKLFEPTWADKKRHKADGLGLGLFVARALLAAHGGTIAVTSSEAAGTTVRIELPRAA